jgi:hypothetical protein
MTTELQPGQILARGMSRHLLEHNFASLLEFVPAKGLRVDILALGPKSEIWIVECKSSLADYRSDSKWQGYLDFCDNFFWCVDANFPIDILPQDTGLMIADGYGGEIMRYGPTTTLAPARRKKILLSAARTSMMRLGSHIDPSASQRFDAMLK